MKDIFQETPCLLQPDRQEGCISIFDKCEDFEIFQLRMGLGCLCQSTLLYPVPEHGITRYKKKVSPHREAFYNKKCMEYCRQYGDDSKTAPPCDGNLEEIARDFCEMSLKDFNRAYEKETEMKLIPYVEKKKEDEDNSKGEDDIGWSGQYYFRYRCPYVHLLKFGFPITVESTVVGILFVGQFSIQNQLGETAKDSNSLLLDQAIRKRHEFENEEHLNSFVRSSLLSIVQQFTVYAQESLFQKQVQVLRETIDDGISVMEEDMRVFLSKMPDELLQGKTESDMQRCFWELVEKNLKTYLNEIGAENLWLFMLDDSKIPDKVHGKQLYPDLKQGTTETFYIQHMQRDFLDRDKQEMSKDALYTQTFGRVKWKDSVELSKYFSSTQFQEGDDILVHPGKIQPFAAVIRYKHDSKIFNISLTKRKKILYQLKDFFEEVGQEFAHFSSLISEHTTKTVLRIYRHEIIHQIEILRRNNYFLDPRRLRKMSADKLQLVAEDQKQCIFELDFMTQNIQIMTGKKSDFRGVALSPDNEIDVQRDLGNKLISLYTRKKQEKTLWFMIKNYSATNFLVSNRELLDMIVFNMMNNAIKYCYPGTNIIIQFEDTKHRGRQHRILLIDYGNEINAEYPEQIFQMYYRGYSGEEIEGSGIGLYVSNIIAQMIGADISWRCRRVSEYNVPALMRFLELSKEDQERIGNSIGLDLKNARRENSRLIENSMKKQIFNDTYLEGAENWSLLEIEEELNRPTFEATFILDV